MSKKLLITGFTPFNGLTINPSYEAVKALPDHINDISIYKRLINTSFETSFEELKDFIDEIHPDYIINVGVACGRKMVCLEKQAFNERTEGPSTIKILEEGPDVLETTLDYQTIIKNVPNLMLSLSAGRFVCNYLMYKTLNATRNTSIKVGFIHVPAMEGMNLSRPDTPKLPLYDIIHVIEDIIITLE